MPFCHSSTQMDALPDDLLLRIFGAVPVYDRRVRNLRVSIDFAPHYELCDFRYESHASDVTLTCALLCPVISACAWYTHAQPRTTGESKYRAV